MKKHINYQHITTEDENKQRLDVVLSQLITTYSRAQIQLWIKEGAVRVNNTVVTSPKTKVISTQNITISAEIEAHSSSQPECIPVDKCFEDDHLIILNKPAGLVVHPGAGNQQGTLMNALLYDTPDLALLPRAGIVHRLDKDTSGIMMVAKTHESYLALTQMLAERAVKRQYIAIVDGTMKASQTIEQAISRHPTHRQKMAVSHGSQAKDAISHVTLLRRLCGYTLVKVHLETGRTHQIRVHMQHIGHPLLGDKTYGHHRGYQQLSPELAKIITQFKRQALHAQSLKFIHPITGEDCHFEAPIPNDMQQIIQSLEAHSPPSI